MQNEIYQQEPNLIAEAYRNYANSQIPRRIEKHFDFIDFNEVLLSAVTVSPIYRNNSFSRLQPTLGRQNKALISCKSGGLLLLGTSNLSGRIWSGSIWVFENRPNVPDAENCYAGIEFESSVASGLWLNEKNVVIGCDSGSMHLLSLTKVENKKTHYFTTEGITMEHDDSIVSLDLMKKKTKVLSGGMDMNIKIWDAETLVSEKTYAPAHGHIVTSVSTLIDNSDTFTSTSLDGTALIWDMRLEKPASLLISNESGFTSSAWVDDMCVSVGSNDGSVSLVDIRMKSEFDRNFTAKRPIFKIKYNQQLDLLAVCADDPFVRLFSCKERHLTNVYESDEHKDFVRGLAWESSSKILYSCGWDSKIFSHKISTYESGNTNEANSVGEE